jgi:hypothetical protein
MGIDGVSVGVDSSGLSTILPGRIKIFLTTHLFFRHLSSIVDSG